jgi:hypothetical protein
MLSFDPDKQPTAAECAERWGDLLRPWIPAQQVESVDVEKRVFQDIVAYLNAVLRGSAAMSSFQWARVLTAMEKIEPKLDPAQTSTWNELRNKIAVMRESVAV